MCGSPTGKGVPLVKNGRRVETAQDFPWHAVVFHKGSAGSPESMCGGSLITTKFVVSGNRNRPTGPSSESASLSPNSPLSLT